MRSVSAHNSEPKSSSEARQAGASSSTEFLAQPVNIDGRRLMVSSGAATTMATITRIRPADSIVAASSARPSVQRCARSLPSAGEKRVDSGDRDVPVEPPRQWCAAELNRLSDDELKDIPAGALNGLPADELMKLKARVLDELSWGALMGLSHRVLNGLAYSARMHVSMTVLNLLPDRELAQLDPCVLSVRDPGTLRGITPKVMEALPMNVLRSLRQSNDEDKHKFEPYVYYIFISRLYNLERTDIPGRSKAIKAEYKPFER